MKTMKSNSVLTSLLATSALCSVFVQGSQAASYQVFTPFAYENPAALSFVKKFSVTLGGLFIKTRYNYAGSAFQPFPVLGVANGGDSSATGNGMPYMQMMFRINSQWVVGFDISTPLYSRWRFKNGNLQGNDSHVESKNYSPKVSFEVNDALSLGAGLDINTNISNFDIITPFGQLRNRTRGTEYGWDIGFVYKVLKGTIISGSYHSQIRHFHSGPSNMTVVPGLGLGPLSVLPQTSSRVKIWQPDVFTLGVTQFFNPNFFVNLTVRYARFGLVDNLTFLNTAWGAPILNNFAPLGGSHSTVYFPAKYRDTFDTRITAQYKFAPMWAGLISFNYGTDPQPSVYRAASLPLSDIFTTAVGVKFMPRECMEFGVTYWRVISVQDYANTNPVVNNFGRGRWGANVLDIRATYKF